MIYRIDKNKCTGCSFCCTICPTSCIKETDDHKFEIFEDACLSCGACPGECPKNAIEEIEEK